MKRLDSTLEKEHQPSLGTGSLKTGETRFLFSWDDVEMLPDLQRLALVLDSLPDDKVIEALEEHRGNGRNEYPVRAMWRALMASFVFQHASVESLVRELNRNKELLSICGFNPLPRQARPRRKLVQDPEKGVTVVEFPKPGISSAPNAWNFSRFIHLVEEVEGETGHVSGMMDTLREQLQNLLPDFGEHMGYDGKAIDSHSTGQVNRETGETSDPDADWGKHETHSVDAQGKRRTRTKTWFGYRLHLIADTVHELPIAFEVTKASTSESAILPKMINELFSEDSNLKQRCKDFSADRGLDSGPLKKMMWEDHQVRPLIDVRQLWREEKAEPGYDPKQEIRRQLFAEPGDNILYSEQGNVYCRCPETSEERPMTFQGFEADRNTLKYRCPAAAAGVTCQGREACYQQAGCQAGDYGRIVRVDLNTADPRIFTPTPHGSPTWKRGYKRRNALERINSRLDNSFGFEFHYLRGQTRMQTRVGLALTIMMALAVGHIRAGRPEQMRSLVGAIPFADTS